MIESTAPDHVAEDDVWIWPTVGERDSVLLDVARGIARTTTRKLSFRRIPSDAIMSVAWIAAREAFGNYDPTKGSLRGYSYRAATRAVSRFLWQQTSIVSAAINDRKALADLAVCPDDEYDAGAWEFDEALLDAHMYQRLCARILEIVESNTMAAAVRAVLLEDDRPRHVADRYGLDITAVYRACTTARKRIGADIEVQVLYREIND